MPNSEKSDSSRSSGRRPPSPGSTGSAPSAKIPDPPLPSTPIPIPPNDDESPTVISGKRRSSSAPDSHYGELLSGRKLAHFELIESIGVGGMAAVLKANDLQLGRVVALKILPPDLATDPENIVRFKNEARAAARLDHENIARVYFCGEDQGLHFIAFEYVEGQNLRDRMEHHRGPLPISEVVHLMIQLAGGLSHAASRGVVHRDIKPSNIVITPEGRAKIVDMGLARNLDSRPSNGQLTQSGVTLGTFDYISPEQAIDPRSADPRSDLYSLGCTIYHVLTGVPPVPEGTVAKKLDAHQHHAPLDPRKLNPAIPDELAAILGRMMAKKPEARYQHPDHLLEHLLVLAEKLQLPHRYASAEGESRPRTYSDRALPDPPRLSIWWIGIAIVVLIIGLYAMTGGFSGNHPALDQDGEWPREKLGAKAPDTARPGPNPGPGGPVDPGKSIVPKEARNVSELVQFLKQGTARIKLRPGIVYDFTRLPKKGSELREALFVGTDLVMECDQVTEPAVIRLQAVPNDGVTPRLGAMTIQSSEGTSCRVRFRGIRFEFTDTVDPDPMHSAIALAGVDRLDAEDCFFVPAALKGDAASGSTIFWVAPHLTSTNGTEIRCQRCYFGFGSTVFRLDGKHQLTIQECAIAPQYALVRATASQELEPARIQLERSTLWMNGGSLVEIGDQVACRISLGGCLISAPQGDNGDPSYLVRQIGSRAGDTRLEGLKHEPSGQWWTNGYHRMGAYFSGDQALTFAECKQQSIPIDDGGARELKETPWGEEAARQSLIQNPLAANTKTLKSVFRLNTRQAQLRQDSNPNYHILGTPSLPGIPSLYDTPFGPPISDQKLLANHKVWQPDIPRADAKPPIYQSLTRLLADVESGDVILVRANGLVEFDPIELTRPNLALTIKADEGFHPVLVAPEKTTSLKKSLALFKLYGGELILEGLQFRLKAGRTPTSVLSLPGGGTCTLRNCAATLEDVDDLSVIILPDSRGEMMAMPGAEKPAPTITLENVFVRGRGDLMRVRSSRPFHLKAKNSVVVLDGTGFHVDASTAENGPMQPAHVILDHTTTFLTKHLVHQKATEKRGEVKGLGLAELQIQSVDCIFVPASEGHSPLVFLDRVDSIEQVEQVFSWKESRNNLYGFKSDEDVLLDIRPDGENMARMERMVKDRWLGKWRESDFNFGEVKFKYVVESGKFFAVQPGDFQVKSVTPPLKAEPLHHPGANVDALTKFFVEP